MYIYTHTQTHINIGTFSSGKSDPFVTAVALGVIGQEAEKSRVKTSTKKRNLNPTYNEVLEVGGDTYDLTDYQGIRIKASHSLLSLSSSPPLPL